MDIAIRKSSRSSTPKIIDNWIQLFLKINEIKICFSLGLILSCLAACLSTSAQEVSRSDNHPGTGYHLFFQTPAEDPTLRSYISIDGGTDSDTGKIVDRLNSFKSPTGEILHPAPGEPVEIVIVVPKGAPDEYVALYVKSVADELEAYRQNPNTRFEFAISYLDTPAAEQVYSQAILALKAKLARPQETEEERKIDQEEISVDAENLNDIHEWPQRFTALGKGLSWLSGFNPKHRKTYANIVAMLKGGTALTLTVASYGLRPTALLTALLSHDYISAIQEVTPISIGLVNGITTASFGYWAVEYSQWTTTHKLLFTRNHPKLENLGFTVHWPGLDIPIKPIQFYNNSLEARSVGINLVRSLGLAYIFRYLAYSTGQHGKWWGHGKLVESPNHLKFFVEGSGITIWEILTDSSMDVGLRALTQKNYTNYMSRSFFIWGISFVDTIGHALFRTGATDTSFYFFGASGVLKLALYAAGRFLPKNDKRITVISNLIERVPVRSDWDFIKKQLGLTEAWNPHPKEEEVQKVVANAKIRLRDIDALYGLRDLSNPLKVRIAEQLKATKNAFAACMWGLSQLVRGPNQLPPPAP